MQKQHARLIEALERVEGFLEKNREVMEGVITSKAHQNFSASRGRLTEHMKSQEQHTRGIRSTVAVKRRLAERLVRAHMRPISVVARKQLPHVGEFAALKLPSRRQHLTSLVAAGHGMARAAQAHAATFLEAGLPADFLEQLVSASDALAKGIAEKGETEGLRIKATVGLRKDGRAARFALQLVDVMVRAAVAKDDALLDQWAKVSRVATAAITSRALVDPPITEPDPAGEGDDPAAEPGPTTERPPESSAAA